MHTVNGLPVTIRTKHMKAHPDVVPVLKEALAAVAESDIKPGEKRVITHDFGRIVGRSGCVRTTTEDHIVFKRRTGRQHESRCVRNRKGDETSCVTMIVAHNGDHVRLITAWVGHPAQKELGDPTMTAEERAAAIEFWSTHALVI